MRKLISIFFVFLILLSQISYAYAYDYVRYVNTGSSGGDGTTSATSGATAAYTSLNVGEAAMDGVVGAGETIIFHCNRTNGGGADTTSVVFDGWNATAEITITQDDFPSDGIFDNSAYYLHNNDTDQYFLNFEANNGTFTNLQMMITNSTGSKNGITCLNQSAAANIVFDSVIIKGNMSGTGGTYGIWLNDSDITAKIYNCLIYDIAVTNDTGFQAIYCDDVTQLDIYNTTIENCTVGINQDSGTCNVTNSIIANCKATYGIVDTVTADYLCDDDNDGNHNQSPAGGDWTTIFTDLGNEDYSLKNTGTAYNNGTDNPGSGLYSDDITGFSRTSTWDIGAFEYDDSGGVSAGAGNYRKRRN